MSSPSKWRSLQDPIRSALEEIILALLPKGSIIGHSAPTPPRGYRPTTTPTHWYQKE